jgi:hypothetical protein
MSNKGKNETLLENEGWDDWDESLWEWDESGMVDTRWQTDRVQPTQLLPQQTTTVNNFWTFENKKIKSK